MKSLGQLSLVWAFLLLAASAAAQAPADGTCHLTLRLVDEASGKPQAGLVRITANGRPLRLSGLVNVATGLPADHFARDWYALPGTASVVVPEGPLTIEAFSGIATELARRNIDVSGKHAAELQVPLTALPHPGGRGWYSANTHLHLNAISPENAEAYLRSVPQACGLDLIFLSYVQRPGADQDYVSNTYTASDLARLSAAGAVRFGYGEEHRHDFGIKGGGYGHVLLLNTPDLVRPVSIGAAIMGRGPDWPPLRPGLEQARAAGGTVIWCHNSYGDEDIPSWFGGRVDAQNIFDGGVDRRYDDTFYRYLNAGLKVPLSSGTDWFMGDFGRVYARLEQPLGIGAWLESLKRGRSYITNGPLLSFQVGSNEIGDTIKLPGPRELSLVGRASGRRDFGKLQAIWNGAVVHEVRSERVNGHFEAGINFSHAVTEPGWFALRVAQAEFEPAADGTRAGMRQDGDLRNELGEILFAHTSAVYVELAGKGVFQRDAAESLLAEMERSTRAIADKGVFTNDAQREEVLGVYREGIENLRRQLSQHRTLPPVAS